MVSKVIAVILGTILVGIFYLVLNGLLLLPIFLLHWFGLSWWIAIPVGSIITFLAGFRLYMIRSEKNK